MNVGMVLRVNSAYCHFEASLPDNKYMNIRIETNTKARYPS